MFLSLRGEYDAESREQRAERKSAKTSLPIKWKVFLLFLVSSCSRIKEKVWYTEDEVNSESVVNFGKEENEYI